VLSHSPQGRSFTPRFAAAPLLARLGGRLRDERGFTLLELLVVILIVGILATIAIPSFIGQTAKALNVQAKVLARTAQTAAETLAAENNGTYEQVSTIELNRVEPSVRIAASATEAYLSAATNGKSGFSVTAKATDGDQFTITRSPTGAVTRQCLSPITKTGCSGAEKGSW
jgi:type IV pilus assembly protein PilA